MACGGPCAYSFPERDGYSLLKSQALVQNLYHIGASSTGLAKHYPPALKSCIGLKLYDFSVSIEKTIWFFSSGLLMW